MWHLRATTVALALAMGMALDGRVPTSAYGQEPLRAGPRPTERVVLPADAAASDPALAEWRRRLLDAVSRRDFDGLHEALLPNYEVSHGFQFGPGAATPEAFVAAVRASRMDEQEAFWRNIRDALRPPIGVVANGLVAPDGVVAYAPYLGALKDPMAREMDAPDAWPYPKVFILADQVRLRADPRPNARVVDHLSFETVHTLEDDSCAEPVTLDGFSYCWQRVESARGVEGWVANRFAFGKGTFFMRLLQSDGRFGDKGRWGIIDFYQSDLR
jgi:hypothetical protein